MTNVEGRLVRWRPALSRQRKGFAAPVRWNVKCTDDDYELWVQLLSGGIATVEVPVSAIALGDRLTEAMLRARVPRIVATADGVLR